MVSLKIASVLAIAAFAAGSLFAPPVQQAIAAVIATDVQCTGCVGSSDVAGNAITAAKIKDGEVKAAEIATDAVGASELQGVTKLLFAQCVLTSGENSQSVPPTNILIVPCTISGVDATDYVLATLKTGSNCFGVARAYPNDSGTVYVHLRNECSTDFSVGAGTIAIIVYDK